MLSHDLNFWYSGHLIASCACCSCWCVLNSAEGIPVYESCCSSQRSVLCSEACPNDKTFTYGGWHLFLANGILTIDYLLQSHSMNYSRALPLRLKTAHSLLPILSFLAEGVSYHFTIDDSMLCTIVIITHLVFCCNYWDWVGFVAWHVLYSYLSVASLIRMLHYLLCENCCSWLTTA